ncbi:hypothetical protein PMIN05_011999 [Paraphaeosphaeria minitans]
MTQALYQERARQDVVIHAQPHSLVSASCFRQLHQRHSPQQASVGRYAMQQATLVRATLLRAHTEVNQPKQQQQQQQQSKPTVSAQTRTWYTNGLPRNLNIHPSTSATGGYASGTSTSGAMSRFLIGATNARAYNHNQGIHMAPHMIMPEVDYQGGLSHQFEYGGTLAGQSIGVKNESEYTDGPLWPLTMRKRALLQPASTADGSDVDTGTASLSPRSTYFSEPSEQGTVYSPVSGREEASSSGTWAEQLSVSPTQIKQSPSHSSLSGIHEQLTYAVGGGLGSGVPGSNSTTVDVAPSVRQQYDAGFASQVDQFSLSWTPMVNQTGGMSSLAWQPSMYAQMQPNTQSPYYSTGFANSFQQGAPSSRASARGAVVQSREPSREVHRSAPRPETHVLPRTSDEQAQREVENGILIQCKAAGLTYKEIRARIIGRFGGEIAESTLRGRHRAMTKQKKDRVRKPTWMPKDVSQYCLSISCTDLVQLRLLREIVQQQLDSIDDGHRTIDVTARLNKVSWKKVGEYISKRGGSYHFGNSTCKKKWLEMNQRD